MNSVSHRCQFSVGSNWQRLKKCSRRIIVTPLWLHVTGPALERYASISYILVFVVTLQRCFQRRRFIWRFSLILTCAMHWQCTGSETLGHHVYKVRETVYVNACWCNKFIKRRWNLNYVGEAFVNRFKRYDFFSNCGRAFEHFSETRRIRVG